MIRGALNFAWKQLGLVGLVPGQMLLLADAFGGGEEVQLNARCRLG
jgi:hypothetical protein